MVSVVSTSTFPQPNGSPWSTLIQVDTGRSTFEIIRVCNVSPTSFTVCTDGLGGRGYDGTAAASHPNGTSVFGYLVSRHINRLNAEVISLEQNAAIAQGLSAQVYNFTPQAPGITLGIGASTVVLSPCPLGVNGTDTNHYLYITGGTGTPESVLISGGTCTAGAASGTVVFTSAGTHTGAWTIGSATAGIQEACVTIHTTAGMVGYILVPAMGTVHAPIFVYAEIQGLFGLRGVLLTAAADHIGPSMVIGASNLARFTYSGVDLDAALVSAITTVIDLHRAESSIRDTLTGFQIVNAANNSTMINLDGCEDSDVFDVQLINPGGTGTKAISWHVPGGNVRIWGLTTFSPVLIEAQLAKIVNSTVGGIVADGFINSLSVDGGYLYPHPTALAHFSVSGGGAFNAGAITDCYLVPLGVTNNLVVFKGLYNGTFTVTGTTLDQSADTGYTFVSSATTTSSSAFFYLRGSFLANGATIGTPASGVAVFAQNDGAVYAAQTVSHSTSSIAATGLLANVVPGLYRIDYCLASGSVTGTGTAQVGFVWNDPDGIRQPTSAVLTLSANAVTSGSFLAQATTGIIQYLTTYAAGSGGNYDLWIAITKVN